MFEIQFIDEAPNWWKTKIRPEWCCFCHWLLGTYIMRNVQYVNWISHLPVVFVVFPYRFSKSFVSFRASKREYRSYRLDVYPLDCLVNECLLCDVKSMFDRERCLQPEPRPGPPNWLFVSGTRTRSTWFCAESVFLYIANLKSKTN